MTNTPALLPELVRPDEPRRRSGLIRRRLLLPLVGLLAGAALLVTPALASADSSSQLTIVGTSDVSDSGLIPNLIGPEFEQAFPQYSFRYIGSATLAAISAVESGADGASMLIVHAASLENQFVQQGFSFQNQFGHAIFRNDFVLAGPTGDPAGIGSSDPHNIVKAFADMANAGINGDHITFVSRGGGPGTTVAEHQIWALVDSNGLMPTGAFLCQVATNLGGGETPIAPGNTVTANGQQCPNSGALPSGSALPNWYVTTGLSQGPNVVDADSCTGFPSGANSCYVFTDRGTYDYLQTGEDPGATSGTFLSIPHLAIVTRENSSSAPGGNNLLINYFHAYIVNPQAPNQSVNVPAAQAFMRFITSPTVQAQVANYLKFNTGNDSVGSPFIPDASPTISPTSSPATRVVKPGQSVTLTGSVQNAEPGFPGVGVRTVTVDQLVAGIPQALRSGKTDSSGHYSLTFTPPSSGVFEVSTGQISQVELPNLNPQYGDILSPGASAQIPVNVQSAVHIGTAHASPGGVTVTGALSPGALDNNADVRLLARKGSTGKFNEIAAQSLTRGQTSFVINGNLRPGTYQLEVSYQDGSEVLSSTGTANVSVPNSSTAVTFKTVKISKGHLTVSGALSQPATGSGAQVKLFGVRTVKLGKTSRARRASVAANSSASFPQIAKTTVKGGKKTFTIKATVKRGFRWALELEFVQKGQPDSFSKSRTVAVH